jgi:hypothetical protein
MRTILLVTLATAVACQETEEIISQDQDQSAGNVEEGTQESADESRDWQVRNDFAGGLDQGFDGLTFFEETAEQTEDPTEEPAEEWGPAPMVEGTYLGTVEMIHSNTCDPVTEGDTWESKLRVNDDGQTKLGGALLESNGDQVRLNRLRESQVEGTVDCMQVETIDGMGTMFNSEEMEFDVRTQVTLIGSDCPVMNPCTDEYISYMELTQEN